MEDATLDFIALAKAAFDAYEQARVQAQPGGLDVQTWSELSIWQRDAWIAVVRAILQGSYGE